ncbi:hypothetical protein [Enterococcus avium]|uniref:hypothetical protein n=1 Tax=Enterococcus avium TaxID=33945 RepID=UPI0032E3BFA7
MNKQEVIERLNNKLDETFAFQQSFKPLTWAHMECESKANAYMTAINYVEQLDEPQKPKTEVFNHDEKFVVEWLDHTTGYHYSLYNAINDAGSEVRSWMKIGFNSNKFARAFMSMDYEVEKEPKWVLKHQNGMYFTRFNKEMEPLLGGEKRAYRFTDESKAEALTIFFNGTVEKV